MSKTESQFNKYFATLTTYVVTSSMGMWVTKLKSNFKNHCQVRLNQSFDGCAERFKNSYGIWTFMH